jgi:hypothetical protein
VVSSNALEGHADELRIRHHGVHLPDARVIPGVVTAALYEWRPVEGMTDALHRASTSFTMSSACDGAAPA